MNNKFNKNTILIIGSCVSRDAFDEYGSEKFKVSNYVARSSFASSFELNVFNNIDLDSIGSKFQREMVRIDTKKCLPEMIETSQVDIILIDFIDERFDLFVNKNEEVCTLSNEFLSSSYKDMIKEGTIIKSGSEEFFRRWVIGWNKFCEMLKNNGILYKLRINKLFWSTLQENGENFFPQYSPDKINISNNFLNKLYCYAERTIPKWQIINYDYRIIKGAMSHKWGVSPFHYIDEVYMSMIKNLLKQLKRSVINNSSSEFYVNDLNLSDEMHWFDINAISKCIVKVSVVLNCSNNVGNLKALIAIDLQGKQDVHGFMMSKNSSVGLYRYLNTGGGLHETSFSFNVPVDQQINKIGVRSWWAEGAIVLKSMHINILPPRRPACLISVDVEALPGRATQDHVERLIWGRFGTGRPAGIGQLCNIFEQFGVKATFFIDYSTAKIHGEKSVFDAAEFIAKKGHDIQLHTHSEVLVPLLGCKHDSNEPKDFAHIGYSSAKYCIEYCIMKYQQNLGTRPTIFRPGGMIHSQAMYSAVKELGIQATSAMYRRYHDNLWPQVSKYPMYRVDNGTIEIPLDMPLDPLVPYRIFESEVQHISGLRCQFPTVSLLIHSWSLLFRERKPGACFIGHHQPYEKQLINYLEYLSAHFDFISHSNLMSNYNADFMLSLKDVCNAVS